MPTTVDIILELTCRIPSVLCGGLERKLSMFVKITVLPENVTSSGPVPVHSQGCSSAHSQVRPAVYIHALSLVLGSWLITHV